MPEASLVEVLAGYEAKGFTGQFAPRTGPCVHCHSCGSDEPAAQTPVVALHRFEGASDPGDEAVVLALECAACGAQGTLVLAYGPAASAEDAGVLAELLDDRDNAPRGL